MKSLSICLLSIVICCLQITGCDKNNDTKTETTEVVTEEESEAEEENTTQEPEVTTTTINYLALGDSYTIGQGVEEAERWPNQLSEKLEENNIIIERTTIIAQTGWTTTNLLNAISENNVDGYNLVSLLIGVNNQFQGRPIALFETEFEQLLKQAIAIAGGDDTVFVVSIPDYGVTPFGSSNQEQIASEIDQYNALIAQKCMQHQVLFIDITDISRELGSTDGALALDNLHPSGSQYEDWAKKILPLVLELLQS